MVVGEVDCYKLILSIFIRHYRCELTIFRSWLMFGLFLVNNLHALLLVLVGGVRDLVVVRNDLLLRFTTLGKRASVLKLLTLRIDIVLAYDVCNQKCVTRVSIFVPNYILLCLFSVFGLPK